MFFVHEFCNQRCSVLGFRLRHPERANMLLLLKSHEHKYVVLFEMISLNSSLSTVYFKLCTIIIQPTLSIQFKCPNT